MRRETIPSVKTKWVKVKIGEGRNDGIMDASIYRFALVPNSHARMGNLKRAPTDESSL
jgi:hypothetical protein